jgi:two-component system, cell cycle response regulator
MGRKITENKRSLRQDLSAEIACPLRKEDCPLQKEVDRLRAECSRLRELSRTDPLTGFFNFRHLLTLLSTEMERTRRSGLPTGLLMIDLDRFKRVNDIYGHETGNRVLEWVSRIVSKNIRRIDMACRFGGEEFAVILPVTQLPQAVHAAERLRRALEKNPATVEKETVPVTASFGVDVYRGRTRLSPDKFIERTDRFLLEAKTKGRNCVCYDQKKARRVPTEITPEERRALFEKTPPEK